MADSYSSDDWRQIPSHPPYEVNPLGQIRLIRSSRILKPAKTRGYLHLSLGSHAKNVRVHRVVAETFLGPCPDGYQVNHKDGDKANPHVGNLEYVTPSENTLDGYARSGIYGTAKRNAAKTHCVNGHAYDEPNTFRYKDGRRQCRTCMRTQGLARYYKHKAEDERRAARPVRKGRG